MISGSPNQRRTRPPLPRQYLRAARPIGGRHPVSLRRRLRARRGGRLPFRAARLALLRVARAHRSPEQRHRPARQVERRRRVRRPRREQSLAALALGLPRAGSAPSRRVPQGGETRGARGRTREAQTLGPQPIAYLIEPRFKTRLALRSRRREHRSVRARVHSPASLAPWRSAPRDRAPRPPGRPDALPHRAA